MDKTQLCIFDYDDTLMKTRQCKKQAIQYLAKYYYHIDVTDEQIESHWGIAHSIFFQKVLNLEKEEIEIALKKYASLDSKFPIMPYEDAFNTLNCLQKKYRLVIVSSCEKNLILTQLKSSNLKTIQFDFIFGASETKFHKPSGRVFDELKQTYRTVPIKNMVYIGDSSKDLQAAKEANIHFFGLDRVAIETQKMKEEQAVVLPSLSKILDYLN